MVPELIDLYLPEEGIGHNIAIVKIEKSYPGQGIKVAHSLWGAGQMMFNKIIIVTDENIDIRDRKAVMSVISKNYIPKRDTHFSRGPLDVLDHCAPQCGYGGKILIDATIKLPEEEGITVPPSHTDTAIYFTHSQNDLKGLINIILDEAEPLKDEYASFWLWGSNCDPIRDSSFIDEMLVMDSRIKYKGIKGFTRDWPGKALSSKETIEIIDKKWELLGLGELIPSPSRKFSKELK